MTVFVVLIPSLAACAWIKGVKKPIAMRSLEEITSAIEDRDSKLDTIRGWVKIKWVRDGEKKSADNAVAVQRPDKMRLEGISPLGTSMYSFVHQNDTVEIFFPSEKRAFRGIGSKQSLERIIPIPMDVEDVIDIMTGRVPLCGDDKAVVYREGGFIVLNEICAESGWRRKIRFEPERLDPADMRIRSSEGDIRTLVTWDAYKEYDGIRMPTKIRVEVPKQKTELIIRFDELEVNKPLDPDQFQLILPPGSEIRPLS